MTNYGKPEKGILELIQEIEDKERKDQEEQARMLDEQEQKFKQERDRALAYKNAVENYALMLIGEYKQQGRRMPKDLREFDQIMERISINSGVIKLLSSQVEKLETQKQELEEKIDALKKESNFDSIQKDYEEKRARYWGSLKARRPYCAESPEEKKIADEHDDALFKSLLSVAKLSPFSSQVNKISDAIYRKENAIKQAQEELKKDEDLRAQFVKRFGTDYYQEAMKQNGFFNDEKDIPLIAMMQMIIKDVTRDEIDMPFVKELKLKKEKIETIIAKRPKRFAEIVASAVGVEPEKMLGYFEELGLSNKFITVFKLREKSQDLDRRLEDLYDKNGLYYGSYDSEINQCEHDRQDLENKEKEIFANLKNDAWTLEEIIAGHKINPAGSAISR